MTRPLAFSWTSRPSKRPQAPIRSGLTSEVVDDLPTRFADFLESIVLRIRAMTVDRVARFLRLTAMGVMVASLGIMAVVFLLLTVYGALEIPLGPDGAFGVLGLILLIGGGFMWSRRSRTT